MAASLSCSSALQALLDSRLAQLRERAPQTCALLDSQQQLAEQMRTVLCGSDFVQRALMRDDGLLESLWRSGALTSPRSQADYVALVAVVEADHAASEAESSKALRRLRRSEMVRLVWRDLTCAASLHATLRETSWLAESVIAAATRIAAALLLPRHGEPPADAGGLVVLGMGKLGGEELNFSSDVDLVFLYPRSGETDGPAPLALEDYYTRQGQLLIRLLDAVTEEGFVFRVDMRLRPFGDSGPLAASFAFFEDYLQTQGRDWERYAYIKARPLTLAPGFDALRTEALRPFVFRRYLDFGVFESLREMKALIARDVVRRDRAGSLKLGVGGIREIEFIVQAFQLVRGGQDGALRQQSLLTVLPYLAGARLLPADAVQELGRAYDFLRLLENRVQMLDDAQTHDLPADPLARERIAVAAGFADVGEMDAALAAQRQCVSMHFNSLFADGTAAPGRTLDLAPLWEPGMDRAPLREQLAACSDDADALVAQLAELCSGSVLRRLDDAGRKRLKALLELLLVEQKPARDSDTRRRVFRVIEAIGLRSAYFSLLVENRRAREQLVEACSSGDFLAAQLARSPSLLDELLDERWKHELPGREALAEELRHRLEEVPDDVEREVEALARFKQSAVFRVALADLSGRLPLMSVSDRLTEIAAIIVECTMALALRQIGQQIGAPCCTEAGTRRSVRDLRAGLRQVRWVRTGLWIGSGPGVPSRFARRAAGDGRCHAGGQPGVLPAFRAAADPSADHAFDCRAPVRGGREAASIGQGRHAGDQCRCVPPLPVRGGVDLGTPGAAACARGGWRPDADGASGDRAQRRAPECGAPG